MIIILKQMGKNNNTQKVAPKPIQKKEKAKKESQQSKLQKLVKQNPHFEFLENGKIRCILTKHQFLPTIENYQKYLTSKSYKNGLESQFDLSNYEEFLTTHKDNRHFFFCRLTGVKVPKKKTAIKHHLQSKRFKYRLEQVLKEREEQNGDKEDQLEFVPEEDEEDEEVEIDDEEADQQ